MGKTICIVASEGRSLINFRGRLIESWIKLGYKVVCISIEPKEKIQRIIETLNVQYVQVYGTRTGIGFSDCLSMIRAYKRAFKSIKPDYVFLYMSKPVALGGYAAIKQKIPHVNLLVNGLENAYYRTTFKDAIIRAVMSLFYRYVSKRSDNVFFQNRDDLAELKKRKAIKDDAVFIIGGSGVDMSYFVRKPLPETPSILMTARLLWSKGIREYLEAVSIVKKEHPETKIMLVGGLDENDEAITEDELKACIENSEIEYCGYTDDVRPFLEKCSIYVLPSYHEGLPRSVLEAMAIGRPIITTDVPGCRETVENGVNGFLVPAKNSQALANSIIQLVENPFLRRKMAEESYRICKDKFEVTKVNDFINKKMFGSDTEEIK